MREMKVGLLVLGLVVMGCSKPAVVTNEKGENRNAATATNTGGEVEETFRGKAEDLWRRGEPLVCTFERVDSDRVSRGVIYFDGESEVRVRGDFVTRDEGGELSSKMIREGNTVYVWSSESNQGTKLTLEPEDMSIFGEYKVRDGNLTESAVEDDMEYECNDWKVDAALFVPPSEVTFVDMSAQMESMQEVMKTTMDDSGVSCSACDQLPAGEAQIQCKSALGC